MVRGQGKWSIRPSSSPRQNGSAFFRDSFMTSLNSVSNTEVFGGFSNAINSLMLL